MAVYPNMQTTTQGYNLLSRSVAEEKTIIFTRMAMGDGELGAGRSVTSLTDLISVKMPNLPITNRVNHQNGHYELEAGVSNEGVNEGFWAREIGVFAKIEDDTTDTLFAYTNGGNIVPFVNDKTTPDIQRVRVDFIVGNSANVTAQINLDTYVTNARLDQRLSDFKKDELTGLYVPTSGGIVTGDLAVQGILTAITQNIEDESTRVATTEFVKQLLTQNYIAKGSTRASYGESGFRIFSDGFCIQWIVAYESKNYTDYQYFPIEFANKGIFAVSTDSDLLFNKNKQGYSGWAHIVDKSRFLCGIKDDYTVDPGDPKYAIVIAFGY